MATHNGPESRLAQYLAKISGAKKLFVESPRIGYGAEGAATYLAVDIGATASPSPKLDNSKSKTEPKGSFFVGRRA